MIECINLSMVSTGGMIVKQRSGFRQTLKCLFGDRGIICAKTSKRRDQTWRDAAKIKPDFKRAYRVEGGGDS